MINFFSNLPNFIAQLVQQPTLRNPIAVSLGAIAGALSRYYLSLWLGDLFGMNFPYGTLLVNASGCIGMGFFFTLITERIWTISPELQILIAVGFFGSYTTFSTYGLDTVNLARGEHFFKAGLYWAVSAISAVTCLYSGILLARLIRP
ncbi:MAG: fluoride efflux transporter CrcB [Cyanobacteriota bacterium]|nr:fluoride efflux transporter CrcB [Cyanobacteriota bacterium]